MGSSRNSTDSDNMQHPITGQMRLIVSNPLLLEFVHLVYHAMDRGAASATQTLHDLARRATYETYAGTFETFLIQIRVSMLSVLFRRCSSGGERRAKLGAPFSGVACTETLAQTRNIQVDDHERLVSDQETSRYSQRKYNENNFSFIILAFFSLYPEYSRPIA